MFYEEYNKRIFHDEYRVGMVGGVRGLGGWILCCVLLRLLASPLPGTISEDLMALTCSVQSNASDKLSRTVHE